MKRAATSPDLGAYSTTAHFAIEARADAIAPVIDAAVQLVTTECPNLIDDHELSLALQEALANAVVHGCKHDTNKQVQCSVSCDATRGLLIIVSDPGAGFNPDAVPPVGEDLFSDHGRGLFLIRQIMDEVSFARNGSEIRMRKFFGAKPTP